MIRTALLLLLFLAAGLPAGAFDSGILAKVVSQPREKVEQTLGPGTPVLTPPEQKGFIAYRNGIQVRYHGGLATEVALHFPSGTQWQQAFKELGLAAPAPPEKLSLSPTVTLFAWTPKKKNAAILNGAAVTVLYSATSNWLTIWTVLRAPPSH